MKLKTAKKLKINFFMKPTLQVAKALLGKYIIRKIGKKKIIGKIIETEAYMGPYDRASHAYNFKKTKRNHIEYLEGGRIYIYLVYGMHWQLNFTTAKKEKPECVLIRALEPVLNNKKSEHENLNSKQKQNFNPPIGGQNSKLKNLTNGPGKLCQYLKLNKSFYGEDLTKSKRIWLENSEEKIKTSQIKSAARVGIDYAGNYWSKKKWRFYLKNNEFISKH